MIVVEVVNDITRQNCPGFAHLTAQTIRIRFEDKDGDFINLTGDDTRNFEEMLLHSKFVEKRNLRATLNLFAITS